MLPAAQDTPTTVDPLEGFDESPASYVRVARALGAAPGSARRLVKLTLLSTFTADVLAPYLVVEGARRGTDIRPTIAPYGQLEQQVLDSGSALYEAAPDVIAIAWRLEDIAPTLGDDFLQLSAEARTTTISAVVERLRSLIGAIRERSRAQILVWNMIPPLRLAAGLADVALDMTQTEAIDVLDREIAKVCSVSSGAYVFDIARVALEHGLQRWTDPRLAHWARVPLSTDAQIATAKHLARTVRALFHPPCKCLVLDLDNTLWGGVLGEDGIGGIALGDEYPGSVYKAFQRQIRSYRDRGVLLAIASKNNEPDVVEAFASHGDLVLTLDDFAARQIHWNDKATSLKVIANRLNIGVDALAFFDDNPVERAWVTEHAPEVFVIDVPSDPLGYASALDRCGAFDSLTLTNEDRGRANMYREDEARKTLASTAGSVEDFIRGLGMRIELSSFTAANIARIAQLLAKTNQFNLTTTRHSQADLERMLGEGAIGVAMRITDRFGDNGLVGVAIAVPSTDNSFVLDSFLMSCRVLGRMAESSMLAAIVRRVYARDARTLWGQFIPTKKNAPAANFLADNGFAPSEKKPGWWTLAVSTPAPVIDPLFEIIDT